MNTAYLHLCVRNDNHCPTCRMWFLSVHKSTEICNNNPIWYDEWVRRRNGDKHQTFTIIKDKTYRLNEYKLKPGVVLDINITHAVVHIVINKKEWCPDNIKFFLSFHDSNPQAELARDGVQIDDLIPREYAYDYSCEKLYSYIIELSDESQVCLNELCDNLSRDKWHA